ncbi:MAG TPA: sugar phosphate isomerase/epimerase family protein [Patescibacteria group bacterium]|nr:sugar phosphate isomerase/epimerase family protein [Patescibacteria group bacterium]
MKLSFEVWPDNPYREMGIVGVCQNSWGTKPIEYCVDRVAEHGYDGVDFFWSRFLEFSPDEYDRLGATLGDYVREKGMEIASVGAHLLTLTPRTWERAAQIDGMKKAIDFSSRIGARTVVAYVAGYYNPPTYKLMTRKDATSALVEMVRQCAEYSGERGLTFSLEPHQETLINTPEVTMDVIDRVGLDNVRVTIDFGGMELGMKPHMSVLEALRGFRGLINHVHAKDITGVIGRWNMCWFGGGLVDFPSYAKALREVGYDDYVCVEWEGWFKGGLEGVGDMSEAGLADMDRAAIEAREFLQPHFCP